MRSWHCSRGPALFAERATAADDRFRSTTTTSQPWSRSVAIWTGYRWPSNWLAWARVRAMGPEEIADRLDERFRLLAGGARRSHERHDRTARRPSVSWSHDPASSEEEKLSSLRRLAVFPACFDLAMAAEAVAVSGGRHRRAVDGVLPTGRSFPVCASDSGSRRFPAPLRRSVRSWRTVLSMPVRPTTSVITSPPAIFLPVSGRAGRP